MSKNFVGLRVHSKTTYREIILEDVKVTFLYVSGNVNKVLLKIFRT